MRYVVKYAHFLLQYWTRALCTELKSCIFHCIKHSQFLHYYTRPFSTVLLSSIFHNFTFSHFSEFYVRVFSTVLNSFSTILNSLIFYSNYIQSYSKVWNLRFFDSIKLLIFTLLYLHLLQTIVFDSFHSNNVG